MQRKLCYLHEMQLNDIPLASALIRSLKILKLNETKIKTINKKNEKEWSELVRKLKTKKKKEKNGVGKSCVASEIIKVHTHKFISDARKCSDKMVLSSQ